MSPKAAAQFARREEDRLGDRLRSRRYAAWVETVVGDGTVAKDSAQEMP